MAHPMTWSGVNIASDAPELRCPDPGAATTTDVRGGRKDLGGYFDPAKRTSVRQ